MLRRIFHRRWVAVGALFHPPVVSPARCATAPSQARNRAAEPSMLVPGRQNPFHSMLLSRADDKVLLARAQYCLFTVSYSPTSSLYSVYCATTNELVVSKEDHLWKCAIWIDERVGEDFIAGLLFGADARKEIKDACTTLSTKSRKRLVSAPDSWGITFLAFKAQSEVIKGMEMPTSLEHASFLLTNTQFDGLLLDPVVVDIASGGPLTSQEYSQAGAPRTALLAWSVLYNVHKRFGTPGTKATLNPVDQIVRRAVKAVSVFIVDIDVRIGKGTIADGITMVVTIFDAQKRNQTIHSVRSLTEETNKLNALTTLLYGEGSSAIPLFIPSLRTKPSQLIAFARTCRPKSPFFVTELKGLSAQFEGRNLSQGITPETDPRSIWAAIRANCAPGDFKKKDEDMLDRYLLRGLTALCNKLFEERLSKISPAIMNAVSSIPPPTEDEAAFVNAKDLEAEARDNPVQSISSTSFLNKVNTSDADVVFGLQRWKAKIYENEERLQKERQVVESMRRYLIVDLETTTMRRYKRIANPFTKDNFVVLSGARDYNGKVFMPTRYFDRNVALRYDDPTLCEETYLVPESSPLSLFLPCLDDYDVIVGHNVKFDLLHLWRDRELRKFLLRGGKIWDTMYGEYLLTGQEARLGRGAGLEDIAKSYGGQTPKLDAVKRAWSEGKETYEIPYATLTEYLHGDLENTELIFRKHMERAVTQSQAIVCAARMDGLLCTTEMEYNGLKTNVELALSQSNEVSSKIAMLRKSLQDSIPTEIPADCRKFFNWASNQHLICYFFGGQLKLNTHARESKTLSGECFDRHTLFLGPEAYPKEQYPNGVFLRPPVHVMSPVECSLMAGMPFVKGTRHFKAYIESYMQATNCRKSSSLLDMLKKDAVYISRLNPDHRSEPAPLANLLPRRHLFLLAAVTVDGEGRVEKFFLKNPLSGQSVTATGDDKAAVIETFIGKQVEEHTDMIVLADEELSSKTSSFASAQVTIIARDANFSFQQQIMADTGLANYFEGHAAPLSAVEYTKRYAITFCDAASTLTFHKHRYGSTTVGGGASPARRTAGNASTTPTAAAEEPVVPLVLPPIRGRGKNALQKAFMKALQMEAMMKPEEWVSYYSNLLLKMGNNVLQKEALSTPSKKRSNKGDTDAANDDLPILLRQRRAFVGYYNALPELERKRLSLMSLVGSTVSTVYDSFALPCSHDDVVKVNIKGALQKYVPNELETERIRNRFRKASTRQLQVGEDTLKYFESTHKDDTAKTLMELRGLEKLVGTYYESTDGGTGMVSLVHTIDSCIHHELLHNKTSTGRLSSANPNCQNIPKEDKSNLRDMFISRFGEKGMCIEADYSQLEVVCLAVLANDEQMLDDLRHNVDFHCKRVAMMRPDLRYTEVLQRAKKNKEPEFVQLRQQAKIFSFQRQYGAGVKMISKSTGLTQDQVRMLIEKEQEVYRGVDIFNNMVSLSANTFDTSIQNGARNVRGHQFYKGMFPLITGSRYIFTESDIPETMMRHGEAFRKSTNFSPTHLKNYPVQGFAGEIVQIILGRLWRHFLANNNYNGLAVLTNTVHDCVWVDCHESIYRTVAQDVEAIMGSVRDVMNGLFPEINITVDFPCDVVAGPNMGSLKPILKETVI